MLTTLPLTDRPNGGKAIIGQAPDQRRALRRLLRDLLSVTGSTIAELAARPRKPSQQRRRRLLYRRSLTDVDLDTLVLEIGAERLWSALERVTEPRLPLPLQAAE